MRLPRRPLASILVAVCLCLFQAESQAQTSTKIRIVAVPIDVAAEAYYAVDMGFFRQAGLDADISSLTNGPAIIAALASGSVDFGTGGTVSIATAHQRGIPIVVVAPAGLYSSKGPTDALVVAKTSTLRSPKDLSGKTIALSGLKTIAEASLHAWADKNHVDFSSFKIVEMPMTSMDAALAAGRVDAADIAEPMLSAALAQDGRVFANFYDVIAPEWMEGAWFCTADFAKAHPELVRKFADVMAQTAVWANAHQDLTAKILQKYSGNSIPPAMNRVVYKERLRAADLQPLIDAAAKYGLLTQTFPASELFAPGIGS